VFLLFYFRSDEQYILAGNTVIAVFSAMIVSLTKIYCTSDLKKKRTPTVYQNATQSNNQESNTAMTVSPSKI
jgi:hypothetical protein